MILYHGSNIMIDKIDFTKCRPFKDFGQGFYCTAIKEQAELMAKRVARIYGGTPQITSFDFNEDIYDSQELKVNRLENPSEEWALFVLNNRDRKFQDTNSLKSNVDNKYDMVVGPVADDDLALLFRTFTRGLIDIDTLVKEMKYKRFSNQYSFHTEKALKFLTLVKGE
ncbi:DUF3990 domain-containing protein [Clostridium gasigenes]|uniref:DUF3990 domain-containing protein n=1 Tax=Clostridium gasigenes TaxID=94869 RepID=UPI001C0B5B95|nr:DUF3990 domain-containing protein [Clostridium gasigenes]MBU3135802.1 DUF3990 domain-containing protein [Clostridium gasigenes]